MHRNPEEVKYREIQRYRQTWLWTIVGFIELVTWTVFIDQVLFGDGEGRTLSDRTIVFLFSIIGIGLPLLFLFTRLSVVLQNDGIRITFFPLYTRFVPLRSITSYEACVYNPILDFGGWGIRWSYGKGVAYSVSGNEGVQLELKNGKRIIIGSQDARQLMLKIRESMALQ